MGNPRRFPRQPPPPREDPTILYRSSFLHGGHPIRGLFLGTVLTSGLVAATQADFATCPPLPAGVSSITVVDRQGRYLGRILPQKRYWVSIDRIPVFLQQALLAVEDARFYEHNGLDFRGIARAFVKDVAKRELAEGGSTITQQLIKNKYLTPERTLDRKLREASLALEFEKQYSKRQILEMYFNEIYFGKGAQGLVQAARLYFDKNPQELTEAECVLLAGVPKNPGRYNPFGQPAEVTRRRDVVLKRLLDLKLITAQQRTTLQIPPPSSRGPGQAPQALAQVRAQLVERLGADAVELGGLDVTAALDLDLQKQAEQALREGVKRIAPRLQGALVCLDPATGDVLAAVGDVEGTANSLNRAFFARRQPGSALKPFIYAAALEKGILASSRWSDEPAVYDRGNGRTWKPLNYGRERFGELSLRQALAHSSNVITVKVLEAVGVPDFVDFAGRMGLPLRTQSGLSLALGTEEVTLGELVRAYAPLAMGGQRAEVRSILRIHDRKRRTWTETPPVLTQVLSPAAAFVTTQLLKDVLAYGTAKSLRAFSEARPAAGKTGTTDDHVDAWFVGYTPNLVTGIWIGYDKPRPGGPGFTGGAAAAPIWERFMRKALAAKPADDFARPETVTVLAIDPETGFPARTECPKVQDEFYLAGTEPTEACSSHGGEPIAAPPPLEVVDPSEPEGEGTPPS